jgi:hypothetical protein
MLSRLSGFSGPLSNLFSSIKGFILNSLIVRYELKNTDSYSGTNTVTDLIGNSNSTLVNTPKYSVNGYLNFDGVNQYIYTITDLQSLFSGVSPNKSEVTSIFMWIYPEDNGVILSELGVQNTFVSVWHTSIIEMVSGTLKFALWTSAGIESITSNIATPFNSWYYVGMVYNGSTLFVYVNGELAGSLTFNRLAPYNSSSGLYYSIAHSDTTNMGDGTYSKIKVGDFQIYNDALSGQEIINNYNATRSNYIYTEDMLIWIDANDPGSYSSGTSVIDLSGNGYTHTLTSGSVSSNLYGFKSFDCTTGTKRIVVDGTGPTLPTTGYTYVAWARILSSNSSFRTLLYTDSPRYTPITIPNGANTLGYWDSEFRSSGYDISSLGDVWAQYAVVGDNSSQTFYINGSQVGSSISYGSGGTTHWGLGNNHTVGQPFGDVGNMVLYNTKLTQTQIKQNYDALKHVYENGNIVTSNLVLYLNPGSLLSYVGSGTTVTDLTGNSLNGTTSNITFTNPYFTYNGSNSDISISDNALLEPGSGDWTMEVWINVSNSTGSRVVLGKIAPGGNAADISYAIRILNGNIRADFSSGVFSAVSTANYSLTLDTWYQFTYVFNNVLNNDIITYVNGQYSSTTTHSYASLLNTTTDLRIGSYNGGAAFQQWFNGKIGIVRLYNSALSSLEVSKNFEANRNVYGL